jgi:hypothetical protein
MVGVIEEEEIGTGALEGQGFLYILMQTRKSLASYFKLDFLTGLDKECSKLGQKGLPSKPHISPVSYSPLMSHCNPKSLKMTNGKRLSTRQSPNIVVGPICLYMLLLHLLTKFPKLPMHTHQCNLPMQARG